MTVRLADLAASSRLTGVGQYSYLATIPLIVIYALGFAIIKYTYGFTVIPGVGGGHSRTCPPSSLTTASHAHPLSIMESIRAKRDNTAVPLSFHRLGTRNVSLSLVALGSLTLLVAG